MASNSELSKSPWAAIAAGVVIVAIVGMQYLTLTAMEAQGDSTAQQIEASESMRRMEISGLQTRQQIILTELRLLAQAAADSHEAQEAAEATEAAAAAAPDEAEEE